MRASSSRPGSTALSPAGDRGASGRRPALAGYPLAGYPLTGYPLRAAGMRA